MDKIKTNDCDLICTRPADSIILTDLLGNNFIGWELHHKDSNWFIDLLIDSCLFFSKLKAMTTFVCEPIRILMVLFSTNQITRLFTTLWKSLDNWELKKSMHPLKCKKKTLKIIKIKHNVGLKSILYSRGLEKISGIGIIWVANSRLLQIMSRIKPY